jgi:predicted O-linked N-acetylglucosamine transferase (SPINDLY family)
MAANRKQRRKNRSTGASPAQVGPRAGGHSYPPRHRSDPRAAQATKLQGDGAYAEADRLWRQILADRPDDLAALQHLGILQLQRENGDMETAVAMLSRAAELLATSAPAQMHAGLALQRAGRLEEAERALRRALELQPEYAEAHNNLGVTLSAQGRDRDAAAAFNTALKLAPDHAAARRNLDGLQGKTAQIKARRAEADALLQREQYDAAAAIYRALLYETPQATDLKLALADALRRGRNHEEAEALLTPLLERDPVPTAARRLLATIYYQKSHYQDALAQLDLIPQDDPEFELTVHQRANVFRFLKRFDEAEAWFEHALARTPDDPKLRNDRGLLFNAMNRSTDASVELLHALTLDPTNWHTYNNLANMLKDQGRMLDALELYEQAIQRCAPNPLLLSNLVLCLNYIDGLSKDAVLDGHLKYAAALANVPQQTGHPNAPVAERRLRIGYISPDFRAHSVARFFSPLLREHDRTKFEVFLYADVANPDRLTEAFRAQADGWRDIRNKAAEQVADLVRADQIDILIDLAGHTGGNRLEVLQRKPAPVQVSWLGYPNTTGLAAVDYRVVDQTTEPTGTAEPYSVEEIVRLPDGFHCMEAYEDAVAVAPPPCQTNGFVRFGSFNYLGKINDRVVETWARILRDVPDSRLLMKARGLGDTLANEAYLALFERHGVERERIEIAPYQPTQRDHLNLYGAVDIALDPFPYNGTTTTCEALWMGVPVVAALGDTHASRVSASLLKQIGHPELIATDTEDYVRRAVDLGHDRARMAELRGRLRADMEASPLRDERGFARKFETALQEMWRAWCARPADTPLSDTPAMAPAAVKTPPAAAQMAEDVRVLHHLARTGGTLVSKCLGSMDGVVLLSEAHPNGTGWIDPVVQARDWFGLIDAAEAEQLRAEARPFETLVALAATRCQSAGQTLVVRDWTHLDYTGVPFMTPSYALTTRDVLASIFDRVFATATVRHPIDEWLSLDRLSLVHGRLSVADYLHGYRAFAEVVQDIGFVRYEDFTHDPDGVLQTLCARLALPFDPGYRTRWADYTWITGDVSRDGPPQRQIRPTRPKPYDPDLVQAFRASSDFAPALELLGYDPVPASAGPVDATTAA